MALGPFDLSGRVAIVTGAHAGLGLDIATALGEAGADVVVTSRSESRAKETAERVERATGNSSIGIVLDQCSFDSAKTMAKTAYDWRGRLDILVNNAGGGSGATEGDLFFRPIEDIDSMIRTNLTGVIYCCREVGRFMVDQGHGNIINLGSIAALVGRDRTLYEEHRVKEQPVDYAAAKAGVLGLTRDLAGKLSPLGVNVNAISPGGFDKGTLPDGFVRGYSRKTPLGRMGEIGFDIKGIAVFLASDAARYVTGQNFVVDGGFSIWK